MNVYKRWGFYSVLSGERTWHPFYPLATGLETMDEVTKAILADVATCGDKFDVEAGESGKLVFSKKDEYKTKIEYTWR